MFQLYKHICTNAVLHSVARTAISSPHRATGIGIRSIRMSSTATSTTVNKLLNEHSTKKHYIEHEEFFSSHLAHGIIALHRLGVAEDRLHRFVDWYIPRLDGPERDPADQRDFKELQGQRVAYYKILQHYEEMFKCNYNNDVEQFIAGEFPKISDGLSGSALHGTIHMGYGYSVKNTQLVLEGIAYLYHSHVPGIKYPEPDSFGKGDQNILDVLSLLANDTKLREAMLVGVTEERWASLEAMGIGMFVVRIAYLLAIHGDYLYSLIESIKIPDSCFVDGGTIDPNALMRTVLGWAITVYVKSSVKNDFFLLHGVTCAWSINQIMPLLSATDGLKVIMDFLMVLFAVYEAQDSPALTEPIPTGLDISATGWGELVRRCVAEDRDEHCYKIVQVCQEMALLCPEFANTCMHAGNIVNDYEFVIP